MSGIDTGADDGMNRLKGRRIVISGAASGIGRATAALFAREGAQLALFDVNDIVPAPVAPTLSLSVDIRNSSAVEAAMTRAADALGGLDGLVNAAGVVLAGPLLSITDESWDQTMSVNLSGTFYMCRAVCRFLPARSASTIVNLASGQGLLPGPNACGYAASKGGVVTLTRALATELAPIRVNSVSPGTIDTPMSRSQMTEADLHGRAAQNYALKRIGDPAEIAEAILFLTSAASSYVTGISLAVDGGRTFH